MACEVSVAIICKIVPAEADPATLNDFKFLKQVQDNDVKIANMPKPLAVFHSSSAL